MQVLEQNAKVYCVTFWYVLSDFHRDYEIETIIDTKIRFGNSH